MMRRVYPRARLTVLAVLSACAVLVLTQLPVGALVPETPTPVTGNGTWFDGLGQPYGGCGLPQAVLETQDFVALNVYNTPSDYTFYPRPLPPSQADKIGMWNNGHNCGRWVRVKLGDNCTGVNDGAPNQAFCRNGSFVPDAYNGAVLDLLVADSCGDANAWCRDDPYHLDLAKASLNRFLRDGVPVGDLYPNHWNNRRLEWSFIPAPNYSGDLQIGFLQGAQRWWPAIAVSRLPNGIHAVEYFANGAWQAAQMNGDMGQSFIIGGTTTGGTEFQIRVRDAADALVNGGRVYSFTLPAACSPQCGPPYTQVPYTTGGPGPTTTTTAPTSTTLPGTTTTTTQPTTTTSAPGRACAATYAVANQWSGNFEGRVTVRNSGTAAITGWRVAWTFPNGQVITQLWSGGLSTSGAGVTVTNLPWNGALGVDASTMFGFIATWNNQANGVPMVTCTAS